MFGSPNDLRLSNTPVLRVVVADDSVLLRGGIVRLLGESDIEVVGQAGDAEDMLRNVRAHKPDAAIIDVKMAEGRTNRAITEELHVSVCAAKKQVGAIF